MKTRLLRAALVGAVVALAAACSSAPGAPKAAVTLNPLAHYAGNVSYALDHSGTGGTLTIGTTASTIPTTGTPPSDAFEGMRFVGYQIYDGLLDWDMTPTAAAKPGPGLATKWQVGSDGLTWTLTLRQGVKFQDGSPFNAAAVVFNLNRMLDKSFKYYDQVTALNNAWVTGEVASYKAVGNYEVQIKTKARFAILPWDMALWLIASPTAVMKYGNAGYQDHPVGTGPFKVATYVPNQTLELVRNTDYWGGAPKLSRIVLKAMPDASTRLAALQSGEIQWAEVPPPDSVKTLLSQGYNVLVKPYGNTIYFDPSPLPSSPASKPLVRQAIAYSIDRVGMCTDLLSNLCVPAYQMANKGEPWYDTSVGNMYVYNTAKAKKLLAQAGYPNGLTLSVAYPTSGSGNMWPPQMMQFIQSSMAKAGIHLVLHPLEWNALSTLLNATYTDPAVKKYDLMWGSSGTAVPANLTSLLSENIPPAGCCNTILLKSKAYDTDIDNATTDFSVAQSNADFAAAVGLIAKDADQIYVAHDLGLRALSPKVRGFVQPESWFADLDTVWVKG